MRVAPVLLLAGLLPAGCVETEETLTLLPDGSGKLHLQIGFKKAAVRLYEDELRRRGEQVPDDFLQASLAALSDPITLLRVGEGVSAWAVSPPDDRGDWVRIVMTAYFDDINRVRIRTFDEAVDERGRPKLILAARMTPAGAGGTLAFVTHLAHALPDIKGKLTGAAKGEGGTAALDLVKPLFKEMRIVIRVQAPGPVGNSRGFGSRDGRAATLDVDGTQLLGMVVDPENPAVRRLEEAAQGQELSWSETTATETERRAFKAELEEAKAAWARRRGLPAAAAPAEPQKPPPLAADVDRFTDDEVDRLFIEAQIKIAREQIERGRKDEARATLQGVLKDYPRAKAAQAAKALLDRLN